MNWPPQLISDLKNRRVAIVLGGGVSKNSTSATGARPKLWGELLSAGVETLGSKGTRHIRSAIKNSDLLHACEWLKEAMDEDWIPFLEEQLHTPNFRPAEIHRHLLALDQRIYISLNFDVIFDDFVRLETEGQLKIRRFCDSEGHDFLRTDDLSIVKAHGTITSAQELIFTRADYARARNHHAAFYDALDACLMTHTFLFVGCGLDDPDFALLLENQRFNYPFARPHYFLTGSGINSDLEKSMRRNRNLKCIKYSPENNHARLTEGLENLIQILEGNIPYKA